MSDIIQIDGRVVEIGGPRKPLRRKTSPKGVAKHGRSSITNNPNLIPNADQRLAWCRRERDLIAECIAALGGIENTSVQEQWIVRTAATIKVITEKLEAKFATAGDFSDSDADLYQRSANSLRRALESIGLQRRAKDIGITAPTAEEYFAFKQRQKEQQQQKDGEVRT